MICRCACRICGKESQGFRILALAGSEWLHVCWRWFCLNAGSRPCSTGGSHLRIRSHPPGKPGRWEVQKGTGLPWGRALGVTRAGNPWVLGTPMGEHRALDQEGKTTPGDISGFSYSIPDLCCDHNRGTSGSCHSPLPHPAYAVLPTSPQPIPQVGGHAMVTGASPH